MGKHSVVPFDQQVNARTVVLTSRELKENYSKFCEDLGTNVSERLRDFMNADIEQNGRRK